MKMNTRILTPLFSMLAVAALVLPHKSEATIVEFQTVLGNFEVNLYDNATPTTVTNFLDYVNNGAYTNSIVHRSVPGFIVQGGGYRYDLTWPVAAISANPAIANEPEFSNLRGTIAMAKTSQPDSATNQWFFNLADNSANLDVQNEGFTVFGEVVGNGMDVVDAIAALQRFDFGSPFGELPLRSDNGGNPDMTNLVIITAVIVTDSTVDSAGAAGLTPTPNTLINQAPPTPPAIGGGGGGSLGLLTLLLLLSGRVLGQVARP
jgi:peptidyl-prolyl cis-trans isomerase A (cyclophilin A)